MPFNLFDSGIYVNADAFAKAGVPVPIKTWQDLVAAVPKLKKAGYIPMAMDGSLLLRVDPGHHHEYDDEQVLQLLELLYGPMASLGKSARESNIEDWARVIKTGTNIASLPEFGEALQLTKWFFDNAVTPNWSGIKGLSGIGLDIPDFVAGKTAMAFGADFAYPAMSAPSSSSPACPSRRSPRPPRRSRRICRQSSAPPPAAPAT